MDPDPAVDRRNSRSSSSSSTSSSSSSSDEDDYFQIDTGELEKPILQPGGAVSDGFEFRQQPQPTQSPRVQVMPGSDPNRIPSSVFARNKSAAPAEWSVASNESLFSIHMGNSSFSRDHILLSMDSSLSPLPPLPLSPPRSPKPKATSPPVGATVGPDRDHVESAGPASSGREEATRAEEEELADKAPGDLTNSNNSTSISRPSDGSTASFSFAFPILSRESRSGSIKVEPEPQQQSQSDPSEKQQSPKTETPKTTPETETKGWLSCFSCCSSCC